MYIVCYSFYNHIICNIYLLCLFFRLHNKGVYVKMGLRKMVSRKTWKDLHKEIRLEVDGKIIDLPPVEGIIILNILRYHFLCLNLKFFLLLC